ncbi:tricarballylate dehydrogenase [Limihaloglobus sulfuriphilus]|uniref:Tricarballylate dehydrogenase n=1 Tax=Limihaloglobus sulfuriphilus TaxID=1851148 RepID=A0A1Q2MGW2_9BACT|nr:FAD-dependent oxidoreductase [Limihaloglobus sulfuriphilus]AQQ71889.1 tricarballylate dehydrogenase [Limihaloglobus sulfuriphilus]
MRGNSLLVEAESFQDYGGWQLDQQFVDTVGSPYLLAHGLGRPVENASTEVEFPSRGTYILWVRTTNWKPGGGHAPGRFRVLINSRPAETTFGTLAGWQWHHGGAVEISGPSVRIELEDLSGFDGRCDALFFTKDTDFTPTAELNKMKLWRDSLAGRNGGKPEDEQTFDVVVVGGGIAGCGAALAAEKQGLSVALVHDRPVLGGNASHEVRVHTEGITGKSDEILSSINTEHWPNGSADSIADNSKRHAAFEGKDNISLFLEWRAYAVRTNGGKIESVDAAHTGSGKRQRFYAPVFIDCTGDGWIGYWAGADYRYGRESRDEFDEGWQKHGELWSPETADNRVMGASLLWYSRDADKPSQFPQVSWAMETARDHAALEGGWEWEYSSNDMHQVDDAEAIRDHMLCAIYGSFANAKKLPENANMELAWVGYILGKRESRRLMGDYIYTMSDMIEGREFTDTVAEETRSVDVHYQNHLTGSKYDFLSTALYKKPPKYYLPFRSLYSRNIKNLMMAGRCFSCSHIGLGGPRVMHTTGQMGVAVGYAASLCKKYHTTPRGVYLDHIGELRELIGYE